MLDIHGEYSAALSDIATVFSVDPQAGEEELLMPYWALDASDLLDFLTGGVDGARETAFSDKIFQLKIASHAARNFPGVLESSITVDTPLPFSLKQLWHELIDFEIATFEGPNRDQPTLQDAGDADQLIAPKYKPHAMGAQGPFLNQQAIGIRRQLNHCCSIDDTISFSIQGIGSPRSTVRSIGTLMNCLPVGLVVPSRSQSLIYRVFLASCWSGW